MNKPGSFRRISPSFRLHYGEDSLRQLPAELNRLGCSRAVIFCGQTLAKHTQGLSLVADALGERHAGTFDRVKAHSPLPAVLAGVKELERLEADAIVAVGGGSAIVTARAAGILLAEQRDIHELCTQYPPGKPPVSPKLSQPKLPQFIVPTTPTTACAKAGAAVVDPALGQRLALFDPKTRVSALFIHPALALTAPSRLALDAGLNAFSMAVQGIESATSDPLADAQLMHALRLLHRYLPLVIADPGDAHTRGQLMLGAVLSGQGTDHAPSGLTSAVSHCIGARFGLDNGLTNALLLPHAMRFNATATGNRLSLIGEAFGAGTHNSDGQAAAAAICAVERFCAELGLPHRLRDVGIPEDALPQLAQDAAGDWFLHQNPRRVSGTAELLAILKAAW